MSTAKRCTNLPKINEVEFDVNDPEHVEAIIGLMGLMGMPAKQHPTIRFVVNETYTNALNMGLGLCALAWANHLTGKNYEDKRTWSNTFGPQPKKPEKPSFLIDVSQTDHPNFIRLVRPTGG